MGNPIVYPDDVTVITLEDCPRAGYVVIRLAFPWSTVEVQRVWLGNRDCTRAELRGLWRMIDDIVDLHGVDEYDIKWVDGVDLQQARDFVFRD